MPQIALFGTSADPPTAGHQQILVWLAHHFDAVFVWASDNPFKRHQTPLQHRAAMLKLLIEEIDPPCDRVQFHPELSNSRSLLTIERARQQWSDAEFTLVIGSDLVEQLPQWYRIGEILQKVSLLVIPRPGYAIEEANLKQLRQMGAKVSIAQMTGPPVSSTAYREVHDPDLLTPTIEAYIHREQLYARTTAEKAYPSGRPADARRV